MTNLANPHWLNHSFLVKVLQSVERNEQEVDVLNWTCNPAVPVGNNYLSLLYCIKVDYQTEYDKNISSNTFIVKTPLEYGQVKEMVESVDGYGREMRMYKELLPVMYLLHDCQLTAQSFDCPLYNSLVLEDLRVQGYKMADRLKQLDKAHCRQSLMSLARFHALSVGVNRSHPQLIQSVAEKDLPESVKDKQAQFMKFSLSAMLSTIEKLEGCERYIELMHSRLDTLDETIERIFKSSGALQVLNHGDAWVNNILFKYNDIGEVVDAKLIDFQTCKYCSFTFDVIFFWWTSANEDVRENHREELFDVYRQTLNQTLEDIGCSEQVSKVEFDNEIKICAPFSLTVMSGLLTVTMADPEDLLDFSSFKPDDFDKPVLEDSHLTKNFRSKYYRAVLPTMLHQAEELGAFGKSNDAIN